MPAVDASSPRRLAEELERGVPLRRVGTAPKAAPDRVTFYAMKNGSGKLELRAQFPTGAAQVVATEP